MFDHSEESMWKACGIDVHEEGFKDKMKSAFHVLASFDRGSQAMEFIIENIKDPAIVGILIIMFQKSVGKEGTK